MCTLITNGLYIFYPILVSQKQFLMSFFITLLMPCPFKGPKMFCDGPNILSQPKHLTVFRVSSKTFVPTQKTILLNANHFFVWHKLFVTATIIKLVFCLAQKIGLAQNILGPLKGQGITNYNKPIAYNVQWD